jgi:riboflavin synthase
VQGHVDAVGQIAAIDPQSDGSVLVRVAAPAGVLRYVVEKGSITVDGVSLTVAVVADDAFSIAMIPHTRDVTTLGTKNVGATVNLEVDVVAKYVEKLLPSRREPNS